MYGFLRISFLFFMVMGFLSPIIHAQQDTTATEVEEQLEEAFEEIDAEDGRDGEQLAQFLEDLAANPVNINKAGIDDLLQIPGINLKIARAIIDYRNAKPFEEKDELLEVSGVGKVSYQRMQPYVTIGGSAARFRDVYTRKGYWLDNNKIEIFSRYQQNLQPQRGYQIPGEEGGYLGNSMKYYQRIKMVSNHLSVNLTQEKDPGETLEGVTGFDYNSGHIALTENGKLKDFVVGDYSLSFGQGLVLWTGGAFGKGREVTGTISKNERGLKAYSSAQETDFFRGVAATYGDKLEVTGFFSTRPRTASVLQGDTTRFPSSAGFHRTQNELARKNNIEQTVVGGRLRLDTKIGLIGVSGYHNTFSNFIGKGSALSNLYDFEGTENSVVGIDYRALVGNSFVFGEFARSQNGGYGAVAGIEAPLGDDTELGVSYRNYSRDFQSFLGSGFGESSSSPQNEEGLYIGLRHSITTNIHLSGYFDQYKFASPRFGTTQPTAGYDVLGLAEFDLLRDIGFYILVRNEVKEGEYVILNERGTEQLLLGEDRRGSIRTNVEFWASNNVRLRSRVELVRSQAAGEEWESGFLIYQDLRLQLSSKIRFDGRVTLFETDSFDTRVYQFESDLLYVMSNTMLSGEGQRAYAVIKYEAADFMDVWLKYGLTTYENVQILGSGLSEVQGNKRSSVGLQVRFRF